MIVLVALQIVLYVLLYYHWEIWHEQCGKLMIYAMVVKDIMVNLISCTIGLFMLSTVAPLLSGIKDDDHFSMTTRSDNLSQQVFENDVDMSSKNDNSSYKKVSS